MKLGGRCREHFDAAGSTFKASKGEIIIIPVKLFRSFIVCVGGGQGLGHTKSKQIN